MRSLFFVAALLLVLSVALADRDDDIHARMREKRRSRDDMDADLERHFDRSGRRDHHEEIMARHRRGRDHGSHNSPEFHEERHRKFLDMNRRRGDRFKEQVIKAKFPPEEEAALLAEIELYHDKEFEYAEHQHANKAKLREEYGRMSKAKREVFREKEKKERWAIRDMRLGIEKRINDRNAANEL